MRGDGGLPEGLWLLELAEELSDSSPELSSDVVSDSEEERMLRMRYCLKLSLWARSGPSGPSPMGERLDSTSDRARLGGEGRISVSEAWPRLEERLRPAEKGPTGLAGPREWPDSGDRGSAVSTCSAGSCPLFLGGRPSLRGVGAGGWSLAEAGGGGDLDGVEGGAWRAPFLLKRTAVRRLTPEGEGVCEALRSGGCSAGPCLPAGPAFSPENTQGGRQFCCRVGGGS